MTWGSHTCDAKLIPQCYFLFVNGLDPFESNCAFVDLVASFGNVLSNEVTETRAELYTQLQKQISMFKCKMKI